MTVVIDTSAVLAILKNEPGADVAVGSSRGAFLSAINLIEVRSKLFDLVTDVEFALSTLDRLEIVPIPFTPKQGKIAADLWPVVRGRDIALADRACLATAIDLRAKLVTADRDWRELGLDIDFVFIR